MHFIDEPSYPVRIGAGSFATVFVLHGGPLVFKVVAAPDNSAAMHHEFEALRVLYSQCSTGLFFRLPKPYAFHDPDNSVLIFNGVMRPSKRRNTQEAARRSSPVNPFLGVATETAAYAMDRVHAIPASVGALIKQRFYPAFAPENAPMPRLCRLYFGRDAEYPRPSRFFNSGNFALDAAEYKQLYEEFEVVEEPERVARAMGEMLASIHWHAGYDARDVEFIMGGDGLRELTYYVIDFNQMRPFSKDINDIDKLVHAHFQNDPYYPRARSSDPLFPAFREGYLSRCGSFIDAGRAFLQLLEVKQAYEEITDAVLH